MRDRSNTKGLIDSFRKVRGQILEGESERKQRVSSNPKKSVSIGFQGDYYTGKFLPKMRDVKKHIDTFNGADFMYFFRDKAASCGYKYVIANQQFDGGIFKRLISTRYTRKELFIMIEFLFDSDQDYLDKSSLRPTILTSSWCNTIYRDSQLWLNDKYVPIKRTKKPEREWRKTDGSGDVKVGEWT